MKRKFLFIHNERKIHPGSWLAVINEGIDIRPQE